MVENGFYYDVEIPGGIKTEDLPKVEKEMQKIVEQKLPSARTEVKPDEAKGPPARAQPALQG